MQTEGIGADTASRTPDLRITNALLYQLSYVGQENMEALVYPWVALFQVLRHSHPLIDSPQSALACCSPEYFGLSIAMASCARLRR